MLQIKAELFVIGMGRHSTRLQAGYMAQGFKSRLTKEDNTDSNAPSYKLEIPLSDTLITLTANNSSENEMLAFANSLALDKIAKLIQ